MKNQFVDSIGIQLIVDDDIDWWSKYYASKGEFNKSGSYVKKGFETLTVRERSLADSLVRRTDHLDLFSSSRVGLALRRFHWFLPNVPALPRQNKVRRRKWKRRRIQRSFQSLSFAFGPERRDAVTNHGKLPVEQSRGMFDSCLHRSSDRFTTERFQRQIWSVHRDRTRQTTSQRSKRENRQYDQSGVRKVRSFDSVSPVAKRISLCLKNVRVEVCHSHRQRFDHSGQRLGPSLVRRTDRRNEYRSREPSPHEISIDLRTSSSIQRVIHSIVISRSFAIRIV